MTSHRNSPSPARRGPSPAADLRSLLVALAAIVLCAWFTLAVGPFPRPVTGPDAPGHAVPTAASRPGAEGAPRAPAALPA